MGLEAFLSQSYESERFEHFLRERFGSLEIFDTSFTDDFLSQSEREHI